jgi:hypothetical protein
VYKKKKKCQFLPSGLRLLPSDDAILPDLSPKLGAIKINLGGNCLQLGAIKANLGAIKPHLGGVCQNMGAIEAYLGAYC